VDWLAVSSTSSASKVSNPSIANGSSSVRTWPSAINARLTVGTKGSQRASWRTAVLRAIAAQSVTHGPDLAAAAAERPRIASTSSTDSTSNSTPPPSSVAAA
jgi:hypothetical protein